jgi:hypothetical protein
MKKVALSILLCVLLLNASAQTPEISPLPDNMVTINATNVNNALLQMHAFLDAIYHAYKIDSIGATAAI